MIILACVLTSLSVFSGASAHPFFVDSNPKPSSTVESVENIDILFSEPLELQYSKVSIIGPDGNAIQTSNLQNVDSDTSSIRVLLDSTNLPRGLYTVTTTVLSAVDGHVVDDSFIFGVGTQVPGSNSPKSTSDSLFSLQEVGAKFPGYVGQIIIVGAAFMNIWLARPLRKTKLLSGFSARPSIDRQFIKLILIGTCLVLASGIAIIIVQSVSIGTGVIEAVGTQFGKTWILRMAQTSVLLGIILLFYRRLRIKNVSVGTPGMIAILAIGISILISYSLISHAAAANKILPLMLDFFHGLAASIWIGGLILLAFVTVPNILRIDNSLIKSAALSVLIPRFSSIVALVLGGILLTGPLLLWNMESDLSTTVASSYGKVLFVKLVIGAAMIAMGLYHQVTIQTKVSKHIVTKFGTVRTNDDKDAGNSDKFPTLKKSMKLEAALGIGLLMMVSLLANMTLPTGEFSHLSGVNEGNSFAQASDSKDSGTIYSETSYTDNGKITLSVTPLSIGQNRFELSFTGYNGTEPKVDNATIKLTQLEKGIGPITIETEKGPENVFVADGALSLYGNWLVEVEGITSQTGVPNAIASFPILVKPKISSLISTVSVYNTTNQSLPLYPLYDENRDSIWVGDTQPSSSRLLQFNIKSQNYTVHPIQGSFLITFSALDRAGNIWYIDPVQTLLGVYSPSNKTTKHFLSPHKGVISSLAIDNDGNLWMPTVQANKIMKFDPLNNKFSTFDIPTPNSQPVAIAVDRKDNSIWFAEAIGKVGRVDPVTGNITEYSTKGTVLEEPTVVFPDPSNYKIYVSEHSGHRISVLNPLLGTFNEYPVINENGLPFGMAYDKFGNLWLAQHEIDKIAVLDPQSGESRVVNIPITGSFIQYVTADKNGNIWFAAQRASALGQISISANSSSLETALPSEDSEVASRSGPLYETVLSDLITKSKIKLPYVIGPLALVGIVLGVLFYTTNIIAMRKNMSLIGKLENKK